MGARLWRLLQIAGILMSGSVLAGAAVEAAYSGLTVVGDRIYTMDSNATSEFVVAFDADSGAEVWRAEIGALFENDYGNGPRSTPTWDDGNLYAVGSQGGTAGSLSASAQRSGFRYPSVGRHRS